MNTNKKYDALKQNEAIKHNEKTATFDALKKAENKKGTTKDNNNSTF